MAVACGGCCVSTEKEEVNVLETNPPPDQGQESEPKAQGVPDNAPMRQPSEGKGVLRKFKVTLNKGANDVVGLDVDWGDMDKLRVTKIKEGLIAKWNLDKPAECVEVGDNIVEINGVRGDAKALLEAVKNSPTLDMLITRMPPAGRS